MAASEATSKAEKEKAVALAQQAEAHAKSAAEEQARASEKAEAARASEAEATALKEASMQAEVRQSALDRGLWWDSSLCPLDLWYPTRHPRHHQADALLLEQTAIAEEKASAAKLAESIAEDQKVTSGERAPSPYP